MTAAFVRAFATTDCAACVRSVLAFMAAALSCAAADGAANVSSWASSSLFAASASGAASRSLQRCSDAALLTERRVGDSAGLVGVVGLIPSAAWALAAPCEAGDAIEQSQL